MIGKSDGERHVQWRPRIRACPPAPVNAFLFDGVVVIVCAWFRARGDPRLWRRQAHSRCG